MSPSGTSPKGLGWLEVSLQLEGELVEPASELLGRIAPGGLVIEPFGGKLLLRAWLPEDHQLDSRVAQLEHGLWHLGQISPFPEPSYRSIPQNDWEAAWKRRFRPLPIGERLLVQPVVPRAGPEQDSPSSPWNDAFELIGDDGDQPSDPDRLTLYLEPGMAFGTGTHPTTRHCLEILEGRVRAGDAVLDLGCGSGILAIAAARLGAGSVLALDTDPQAVELARANLRHNRLTEQVTLELGSLAEVPQRSRYQLILANIQAAVIEQLLDQRLSDHLAAEGVLIAAGILEDQRDSVEAHARAAGLTVEARRAASDWRTLALRPAPSD